LRDVAVNKENIREYIAERERRGNASPGYLNTLRARERDHEIFTGRNAAQRVDDLSPTARKRINDRLSAPKKDRTPEVPETPEAPEAPKKPKPEAPEPEAPAGPRTSSRRIVRLEDVSDDVGERRRVQREVAAEVAQINRYYPRWRDKYVSQDDDKALGRLEEILDREYETFGKIADDKSKRVRDRYSAREQMRAIQDQKMGVRKAREGLLERRRAAEEAANAPEAPSGPRTPRTPDTGNRTETFGLSKEERTKLDRFAESDRTARENQRREIERLIAANEDPDALIGRRLNEANELLSDYKRDTSDSNADASDRYIATQSLEDVRAYRDALMALRDRNTADPKNRPESLPEPEQVLLVPDEAKQKELRQKFRERADAIIKKRNKIIGSYMTKRYGSGKAPWKDSTKNKSVAELKDLLTKAQNSNPNSSERSQARLALEKWTRSVYELPEFEAKEGKKFRTRVTSFNLDGNRGFKFEGKIETYNEANQSWDEVGVIKRSLTIADQDGNILDTPRVNNNLLKIYREENKKFGFATVYNQHAFTWLKASGFKVAALPATGWDGPFVWGKAGYRTSPQASRALAQKLEIEIQKIRSGGRSSVINKRDADIIAALIDEARRRNFEKSAPQHAEYLMAMGNRDKRNVKGWFKANAPFNSGEFPFDDVPDDPR
jgi:hypothetical protein